MFTHPSPTFIALGALAIAGCTSSSYRPGQSASVQFGTVVNAREVVLDSNADSGAIVGGTLGLVMGSGRRSGVQARNAILGAGVGAALAGAAEGNRRGMQYTVALADGSETRIVTDQRDFTRRIAPSSGTPLTMPCAAVAAARRSAGTSSRMAASAGSPCGARFWWMHGIIPVA